MRVHIITVLYLRLKADYAMKLITVVFVVVIVVVIVAFVIVVVNGNQLSISPHPLSQL